MEFSSLNKGLNLETFSEQIEKGKKVPIGTVKNGYKKIAEGKWQKVSEHGLTKKEHQDKAAEHRKLSSDDHTKPNYKMSAEQQFHDKESFKHGQISMKLNDKEYNDTDVEGGKKKSPTEHLTSGATVEKSYVLGEYDHDSIQKSHITEMFGYQNNLNIDKTGVEIKEALKKVRNKEENEKNTYHATATTLLASLGCEPTEEIDNWVIDGYEDIIGSTPKLFPWRETYCESVSEMGQVLQTSQGDTNQKDVCKQKDDYNRCIRKYIDAIKEIAQIDTMINNLDDKKKYQLTIKQATILGF